MDNLVVKELLSTCLGLEASLRPIGRPRKPQDNLQSLFEDDADATNVR